MELKVTSSAFQQDGMIPARYTCDGADVSPPLAWNGVPEGAKSLALICDDPDAPAGTWVHWVLYNLPPSVKELPEAVPAQDTLANGARQGTNSDPKTGYSGPCPPGGVHRYFFKLYALDCIFALAPGATKAQLEKAMAGHIVAKGELMGKYKR